MDKNDYHHSFKTCLKSRSKTKFKSSVKKVNLVDPKYFKKIIQTTLFDKKKSIDFLLMFYPELTRVID
jgi:hypothetical protein